METTHVYRLEGLRPRFQTRLRQAQMEAAQVWMLCRDLHLAARKNWTRWPKREDLQQAAKKTVCLAQPDRADDLSCPHFY